MNDSWCQQLEDLMQRACAAPPKSEARRRLSDRVIRHLQSQNIPYSQSYDRNSQVGGREKLLHQEAASLTWKHFFLNLCECQTQNTQSSYVSSSCEHVKGRLFTYYKGRLKDLRSEDNVERKLRFNPVSEDGEIRDPLDVIPSPLEEPDYLNELCRWIQSDESGILRQTHLRDKPHISAQELLLRRLCKDLPWAEIAKELGVATGTLAPFFQNRCLPPLRHFIEEQGYIDPAPLVLIKPENPNLQMDLGEWLETDPTGILQKTHLKNRPDITAQLVLLREFKSQEKLKDVMKSIAQENDLRPERLKAFYYRNCKPLLVEFGKQNSYSEK